MFKFFRDLYTTISSWFAQKEKSVFVIGKNGEINNDIYNDPKRWRECNIESPDQGSTSNPIHSQVVNEKQRRTFSFFSTSDSNHRTYLKVRNNEAPDNT